MSFIIYESDPLVCADIKETLAAAFPQRKLAVCAALGDIIQKTALTDLAVAVLSLPQDTLPEALSILSTLHPDCAVVLILDDAPVPDIAAPRHIGIVLRPFNTDSLIAAVNDAFSGRPSSQPKTPLQY